MRRRFLVERLEGGSALVRGEQARHLRTVLRARPGQLYELSDGSSVWLGKISRVERDGVEFVALEPVVAPRSLPEVTLLLSLFRYARFEWAIEKAVELGVAAIQTVAASRSELRLVESAGKRLPRWERLARQAAEQSRSLRAPRILPPLPPGQAFGSCRAECKLLLSERRAAPPIERLRPAAPPAAVALAFGPEGGWTDEEIEAGRAAGFSESSLGPRILRTETAVIAGLSVVLCAWPSP